MSVKMRQEVERKIVGQFVRDALKAGLRLSVSLDRGYDVADMLKASADFDAIMEAAFAGDECHIFTHEAQGDAVIDGKINSTGWVFCVYGNDGYDVISDYTTNLESLLAEANKIADHYADA